VCPLTLYYERNNIILDLADTYIYNISVLGTGKSYGKQVEKMQIYFLLGVLAAFALLGFGLSRSIKRHDAKMATMKKKKKGRSKYMREFKRPGK
jgi:hypothetical protein